MSAEVIDVVERVRGLVRSSRGVISATIESLDIALKNRDWDLIEATAQTLRELVRESERISP